MTQKPISSQALLEKMRKREIRAWRKEVIKAAKAWNESTREFNSWPDGPLHAAVSALVTLEAPYESH